MDRNKIIRGEDAAIDFKPQHLNPIFIEQSPAIALTEAQKEIIRMAEFSLHGLKEANQFLNTQDKTRKHGYSIRRSY